MTLFQQIQHIVDKPNLSTIDSLEFPNTEIENISALKIEDFNNPALNKAFSVFHGCTLHGNLLGIQFIAQMANETKSFEIIRSCCADCINDFLSVLDISVENGCVVSFDSPFIQLIKRQKPELLPSNFTKIVKEKIGTFVTDILEENKNEQLTENYVCIIEKLSSAFNNLSFVDNSSSLLLWLKKLADSMTITKEGIIKDSDSSDDSSTNIEENNPIQDEDTKETNLVRLIWARIWSEYEEEPYPIDVIEYLKEEKEKQVTGLQLQIYKHCLLLSQEAEMPEVSPSYFDEIIKTSERDIDSEIEDKIQEVKEHNLRIKTEGTQEGLKTVCIVRNFSREIDTDVFVNALQTVTKNGTYGEVDMEIKVMSINTLLSYNMHKWGSKIPNPTHKDGGLIVINDIENLLRMPLHINEKLSVITQIMRNPAGKISTGWGVIIICKNEEEVSFLWDRKNLDFKDCMRIF